MTSSSPRVTLPDSFTEKNQTSILFSPVCLLSAQTILQYGTSFYTLCRHKKRNENRVHEVTILLYLRRIWAAFKSKCIYCTLNYISTRTYSLCKFIHSYTCMHDKIHKSSQFTVWMQKKKPFKEKTQYLLQ